MSSPLPRPRPLYDPCRTPLTPQRLETLKSNPDFLAYLSYVLVTCGSEQDSHRSVAGLLLKNSFASNAISTLDPAAAQALTYVKSVVLQALSDKEAMIRTTAGTVITTILQTEEPGAWPEALDVLTKGMGSQDAHLQEVRSVVDAENLGRV